MNFVALDVFTGKKLEHVISSTHNVDVPRVKKHEYTVRTSILVLVGGGG